MADKPPRTERSDDWTAMQISRKDWKKLEKVLVKASGDKERVDAIVSTCVLDERLERLLRTVMIEDKSVDELMNDDQTLQSFSSKLRLAYALGLLPKAVKKDLQYLNKIRNIFAHEAKVKSLDDARVCDLCRNLSMAKLRNGKELPPKTAYRVAVYSSIYFLIQEIRLKEKKKESRQRQSVDSVESRYKDYLDGIYEEAMERVKQAK